MMEMRFEIVYSKNYSRRKGFGEFLRFLIYFLENLKFGKSMEW